MKKNIFYQLLILLLVFSADLNAQMFTDINPFPAHQNGLIIQARFVDIDADGWLDVVADRMVYMNQKNGTFKPLYIYPIANNLNYFNGTFNSFFFDYDGDNDMDMLICYQSNDNSKNTKILRNDGKIFDDRIEFVEVQTLKGVTGSPRSVCFGDYDNDGDIDIALSGSAGVDPDYKPITLIYKNNNGNFVEQTIDLRDVRAGSLAWIDYDNDADLDLLISGNATELYAISPVTELFNNDDGVFTVTNQAFSGLVESSIAINDYNSDGFFDFFLMGRDIVARPSELYQNINKTFAKQNITFSNFYWGDAVWADFDNDGDADLAASGEPFNENAKIYRNDLTSFSVVDSFENGRIACLSSGDFDNDGDIDLLVSSFKIAAVDKVIFTILSNNSIQKNAKPGAPSALKSNVNNKNVTLSWDASSDDRTNPNGLTYNLRIGRISQANDVCPSMALSSGERLIAELGNVQNNRSWTIENLPDGKYYWSVQSIDNNYEGSAFAPEQTFVIGAPIEDDTLKVIYPNGGENLAIGSNIEIKWNGLAASQDVLLEYSIDNGSNWNVINTAAKNGKESWTVPNSPSNQCLARVSTYYRVDPKIIQRYEKEKNSIVSVRFNNNDDKILVASLDSSFYIWDRITGNKELTLKNPSIPTNPWTGNFFNYADWSFDNKLILTVNQQTPQAIVSIWDVKTGVRKLSRTVDNDQYLVYAAISPDNKYLAIAEATYIRVYEIELGHLVKEINTFNEGVPWYISDLAFSANGEYLCASRTDSTALVCSTSNWEIMYRFQHQKMLQSIDISPDSKKLLTATVIGEITEWDLQTHSILSKDLFAEYTKDAQYNSDASLILINAYKSIYLWDKKSKKKLANLSEDLVVNSIDYSHDDKYIVESDTIVKIWELNPIQPFSDKSDNLWRIIDASSKSALIKIDSISSPDSRRISVPIRLVFSNDLDLNKLTGFDCEIEFNKNVLYPEGATPLGNIVGDNRRIKINLPAKPIKDNILYNLEFSTLLGTDSLTKLNFISANPIGDAVDVTTENGAVLISNICREGGVRLVINKISKFKIFENPDKKEYKVNYQLSSDCNVSLKVFDLLGREILTLVDSNHYSGEYIKSIDLNSLPNGVYNLILEADGDVKSVNLSICN